MPRSKKKPPPPKPSLTVRDLAPLAREEALRLAKGDRSRIEVLSKTSAVVR